MCSHKRAFILSDGLIGEDLANNKQWISCSLHKRNFELTGDDTGRCGSDETVNIATFEVEERDDGWFYVKLPPVEELDAVLGTGKWRIKKGDGLKSKATKEMKGKKGLVLMGNGRWMWWLRALLLRRGLMVLIGRKF